MDTTPVPPTDFITNLIHAVELVAPTITEANLKPRPDLPVFSYLKCISFESLYQYLSTPIKSPKIDTKVDPIVFSPERISDLKQAVTKAIDELSQKYNEAHRVLIDQALFQAAFLQLPLLRGKAYLEETKKDFLADPREYGPAPLPESISELLSLTVKKPSLDTSKETPMGNCAISETVGQRDGQEDAFVVLQDTIFNETPSADVPTLLGQILRTIAVPLRKIKSGATACFAHYSKDHQLRVANIGDSRASLFLIDKKNKVTLKALTFDHKPIHDKLEWHHIYFNGGYVRDRRVNGRLALARSFGDSVLPITSEADISHVDLRDPQFKGKRILLVVACDGTYEEPITEWDHVAVLEKALADPSFELKDFSRLARNYASQTSEDNITVLSLEIDPSKDLSSDFLIAVFDGHSGAECSYNAKRFTKAAFAAKRWERYPTPANLAKESSAFSLF